MRLIAASVAGMPSCAARVRSSISRWASSPYRSWKRAIPAGNFYALEAARRLGLGDAGGLRIGLAPYSDDDDVDRLLDGLREFVAR